MTIATRVSALPLVLCGLVLTQVASGKPPAKIEKAAAAQQDTRSAVEKALDKPVTVDFSETPLTDVIRFLSDSASVPMLIDQRALEDVGIDAEETPITKTLPEVSLRAALRVILSDLDLTFVARDELLQLTTVEVAEVNQRTVVLDVHDLLRSNDADADAPLDYDSLIELITIHVTPDSWDEVGGPGSLSGFRGTLVLSQDDTVIQEVRDFLAMLRLAKMIEQSAIKAPAKTVVSRKDLPAYQKRQLAISKAMDSKVTLDFDETPLRDVVAFIRESYDLPLIIHDAALDDVGLDGDTPVSISVSGIKLRPALNLLLQQLELKVLNAGEIVTVTTPDLCDYNLSVRVYPVRDLTDDPAADPTQAFSDFDSLIELITTTIEPSEWDEVGGPCAVSGFDVQDVLVVSGTDDVHERLENLLISLRKTIPPPGEDPVARLADDDYKLVVYVLPASNPAIRGGGLGGVGKPSSKALPQFGGGMGGFGGGGMGGGMMLPEITDKQFLELASTMIEPRSWNDDKVYARAVSGRLIIRHKVSVHREIRKLADLVGVKGFQEAPKWWSGGFF